MALTANEQV